MIKYCIPLIILSLCIASCSPSVSESEMERTLYSHMVQMMPGTTESMQTAGYWIARAQNPDEIIMSHQDIAEMNMQTIMDRRLRIISSYLEYIPSFTVYTSISDIYGYIESQEYYHSDGKPVTKEDKQTIKDNINLKGMNLTALRHVSFAIITERVSLRAVPTDEMYLKKGDSGYFDRLQMSNLEVGTPVAVMWRTYDRQWLFVESYNVKGWVPADSLAYCTLEELKKWELPENFAVVTKHSASIYANNTLTEYRSRASMGDTFPIAPYAPVKKGVTAIYYPTQNKLGQLSTATAYIDNKDVNNGYLPYTPRNLLSIAFDALNAPYGWGGMFGEQDCSGFVLNVFKVFGIMLPRNSAEQGLSGDSIYAKKVEPQLPPRQTITFFGIPGATVVQFPGHIMLYVGSIEGEPYAIHSTWSYKQLNKKEKKSDKDTYTLKMPARVVLGRMNFDNATLGPTYAGRVTNISVMRLKRIIDIPQPDEADVDNATAVAD